MGVSSKLILGFLNSRSDISEIDQVKFIKKHSNDQFYTYKVKYITPTGESKSLRLEFDVFRKKLFYGTWYASPRLIYKSLPQDF